MPSLVMPRFMRQPGPLRIVLIGTTALVAVVGVAVIALTGRTDATPEVDASRATTMPQVNALPGGRNANPALDELRIREAMIRADQARRSGDSATLPMGAMRPYEPGAAPDEDPPRAEIKIEATRTEPRISVPAAPVSEEDIKAHQEAIKAVLASWRGKAPAIGTYEAPRQAEAATARPGPADPATGAQPQLDPRAPGGPQRRAGPVLIAAGYSVYGYVIQGGNSDQGSPPIIVEALTGPIAGQRMTGTFMRPNTQNGSSPALTVTMNKLTMADGRQRQISAYLVSPDTGESQVFSREDPHTVERVILPMAAAFAAGLGQGLGASGSVVASSPYGGFSAFRQFTPQQLIGIGAGSAGQTASQLLRERAPRQSTVYIDRGAEVSIMFAEPLEGDG